MDPIDQSVWNGVSEVSESYDLTKFQQFWRIAGQYRRKPTNWERQLVIQSLSLDTIQKMAERMNEMHSSLPAIKPVREDKLPPQRTITVRFRDADPSHLKGGRCTRTDFGGPTAPRSR